MKNLRISLLTKIGKDLKSLQTSPVQQYQMIIVPPDWASDYRQEDKQTDVRTEWLTLLVFKKYYRQGGQTEIAKITHFVMQIFLKIPHNLLCKNVKNHTTFVEGFWPVFFAHGRFMECSMSVYVFLMNERRYCEENKLGLSCAKLSTAWASYPLANRLS